MLYAGDTLKKMKAASLNAIFSTRDMKRRYEAWFLRFALADGSGAWWLRYLLLNLGRSCFGGCGGNAVGFPVQVWATWFPRGVAPQHYLAGLAQGDLQMSGRFAVPFFLECSRQRIEENFCRAAIEVDGHKIAWDLKYRSTQAYTMSDKGWIGFTRTPHADAVLSGKISLGGKTWRGNPLGFGVQGHNSGYRHRRFWTWAHVLALSASGKGLSSFEALEYEMPLGLRFRRALLWHEGIAYDFRRMKSVDRNASGFQWIAEWSRSEDETTLVANVDGSGVSAHRLPYLKTDCSGTFEVTNNSLASAKLQIRRPGKAALELSTNSGAVLEMAGG
jgi:hypothetical protein